MRNRGNIILIVLVVVALVVVGLVAYALYQKRQTGLRQQSQPSVETVDQQVTNLQQLSPSDEVSAIEEDLDNTGLDQLDSDLNQVDAALSGL